VLCFARWSVRASASRRWRANGHDGPPTRLRATRAWPLDLDWLHEARFTNRSATGTPRRHAALQAERKKAWQAAWLLRAITCHRPDYPAGRRYARHPYDVCARKHASRVRQDILHSLGVGHLRSPSARCASTTISSRRRSEALAGSGIPSPTVSTGFPGWPDAIETKLAEIRASLTPARRRSHCDLRAHV